MSFYYTGSKEISKENVRSIFACFICGLKIEYARQGAHPKKQLK